MRSAASIALVALLASVPALAANTDAGRIRTFESSLRPAVSVEGESEVRWSLRERMEHRKVPGLSIAVIRGGKLAWARGYGVLQAGGAAKVDTSTVFSVGSVSKVAAAAVTLRLADAGKLDLDRNVNAYLTRWRVPDDAYTTVRPVTLRGLLSHSAGFTINGFKDFQPDEKLPTVLETLAGRAPATHGPVRVIEVPGTRFRYSGGGITVEQLVIEDATGLDFQRAARQYVLEPLGMRRSSFENPLPESFGNIAKAHDGKGQPRALPRGYESMPEMAASGLWTSASDCAQLVIALIESYRGGTGRFLSTGLARQMMTEVGRSPAGLGPFLQGQGADRRFFHGGANDSYRAWIEGHLGTGNGVVILTNGSNGTELISEVQRAVAVAEGWSDALSDHMHVPALALSTRELEEKTGVYEVQSNASTLAFRHRRDEVGYRVAQKNGSLYLSQKAGDEGRRLIPTDASRFVVELGRDLVTVEFVRNYDGVVSSLILRSDDLYFIEAQKVASPPAAAASAGEPSNW